VQAGDAWNLLQDTQSDLCFQFMMVVGVLLVVAEAGFVRAARSTFGGADYSGAQGGAGVGS